MSSAGPAAQNEIRVERATNIPIILVMPESLSASDLPAWGGLRMTAQKGHSQRHMETNGDTERFGKLSQELLRALWRSNPVGATLFGIHEFDHTLGDVSADAFQSYARTYKSNVEALQSQVDPSMLDPEDEMDYHLAMSLASSNYITLECRRPWANDPSLYPSICIWGCFALLMREFGPVEERMQSMLGRMREIPNVLDVARSNIADPPPLFVQVALEVLDGAYPFFRDAVPNMAAQVPSLRADILAARDRVLRAFEDYRNWLSEEVLPNAVGRFAVGRDTYEQMLFGEHYLTYSPADLVLLGEGVLKETREKTEELAASIDPSVTWQELIARLKQDHPARDELADAYRREIARAREFVAERDLVTIPEGESLEVCETPAFERSTMPYAAYFPPAPFGTAKSGRFWVTPVDDLAPEEQQESQLLGHCTYTIPVIALHEGYPGHHLQLTRAVGLQSPLRKQMMNNLLIEGWALYCEEMMYEQGFYTDPKVRLFQLKDMLWRACRVVIDVGLHTGEMTFEEAVRMLVDAAHLEEVNAVAEVKRYAMNPTQPMTYVIGRLLILDLRDRMKRLLGTDFDLKRFHDQLLSYGSIQPSLIVQRMSAS